MRFLPSEGPAGSGRGLGGYPASFHVSLRQTGEPERDRQTLVYTFAVTTSKSLTYQPGDLFFAELPVRKGDRDLKLTWAASRTMSYQFERLLRECSCG